MVKVEFMCPPLAIYVSWDWSYQLIKGSFPSNPESDLVKFNLNRAFLGSQNEQIRACIHVEIYSY